MKYETARRIARIKALRCCGIVITGGSQTNDAWVFSLGAKSGETITANLPMFVFDKEGNSFRQVRLPSKEGFAILNGERPI